ncbi:MAG: DinB family protein [Flavobacteriales bacterium]|nr:DinB family protein [Flavobacteriales bacterium]
MMTKKQRLLAGFDRMERDRLRIVDELSHIPPERSAERPAPDAWSVAQVITHLAMAEEKALAYLEKKLEVKKHGPVGHGAPLRLWFLNTVIRLPLKYKAPAIVADIPCTSYAVAKERWAAIRLRTRQRYQELDEKLLGHDLYKHPILGKFNLLQGLRFMAEHVKHHEHQIQRILRAVDR